MASRREHYYRPTIEWTGNTGAGTADYRSYSRDHIVSVPGRPDIPGSADPAFRGDATRHNPEDILVASLSSCHMLWYLHLAAEAGIVVTAYRDNPVGLMVEDRERGGWFERVTLNPVVTMGPDGDTAKAQALHSAAHGKCFIANSVNFPVECCPMVEIA
jgi:organic hydroperoxide reductase OsmC/OhrA